MNFCSNFHCACGILILASSVVLKISPSEVEALQSKVVCMIQLNDFQNALNVVDKAKHATK